MRAEQLLVANNYSPDFTTCANHQLTPQKEATMFMHAGFSRCCFVGIQSAGGSTSTIASYKPGTETLYLPLNQEDVSTASVKKNSRKKKVPFLGFQLTFVRDVSRCQASDWTKLYVSQQQ